MRNQSGDGGVLGWSLNGQPRCDPEPNAALQDPVWLPTANAQLPGTRALLDSEPARLEFTTARSADAKTRPAAATATQPRRSTLSTAPRQKSGTMTVWLQRSFPHRTLTAVAPSESGSPARTARIQRGGSFSVHVTALLSLIIRSPSTMSRSPIPLLVQCPTQHSERRFTDSAGGTIGYRCAISEMFTFGASP